MSIDATKLAALLALTASGGTPQCGEFIRVDWDESHTNYYGTTAYHELGGYIGIGHLIEPRIIPKSKNDPFFEYEICPDLRTDNISITFDDIDKTITQKFRTYSSGVACFFYLYYPDVDLTIEMWSGQLEAPSIYGWKTVKATATNGFRSRELIIPGRNERAECTAQIFAGKLPDAESVRSSLCPYDRHVGGTVGLYKTGTTPFTDCPKTKDACTARFGHARFYGGFVTKAEAVNYPYQGHPFLAMGRGNAVNTDPVKVVFGRKNVHNITPVLYRVQSPPQTNDAWVDVLWVVCEGPIVAYDGLVVNQSDYSAPQWANQFLLRLGTRGQTSTGFPGTDANYSSTAVIRTVYGGPHIGLQSDNFSIGNLTAQCSVKGFAEVCIFTDPDTFTREWSDDRVFCLLELMRNQKFGVGYPDTKFILEDWIAVATFLNLSVSHTLMFPDGETQTYVSRRSSFNAILEGRQMSEQIEDICRAGGISVPFTFEGRLTLSAFRAATSDELAAAKVFTDRGQAKNIDWIDLQPSVDLNETPANKVVNEVELRFEDLANGDIERPLTVDDPDQKLKAGRQLGPDYFLSVPKRFVGTGINNFAEAVRMAYRLLKYGEFDEGGTDNNLKVTIKVPLEQALGIKRYEIITIDSALLDEFDLPSGVLTDTARYPVEYFRVLHLKKVSGNRCEITAQVYNHNSYTHFETTPGGGGGGDGSVLTILDCGTLSIRGVWAYAGELYDYPSWEYNGYILSANASGTRWQIWEPLDEPPFQYLYYWSSTFTGFPWEDTWGVISHGAAPVPTVVEGIVPTRPARELTIGTPVVDANTGLVTVEVGS